MVRFTGQLTWLDDASRQLLSESGLPSSAAPFIGFDETASMPRVWDLYSPGQWTEDDKVLIAQYHMIGSDGSGNPICVDERTGEVWLLDHEVLFGNKGVPRELEFMNSSIAQRAECLLAYMGEDAPDRFRAAARDVDARAMDRGTFWSTEADQIGFDWDSHVEPVWKRLLRMLLRLFGRPAGGQHD